MASLLAHISIFYNEYRIDILYIRETISNYYDCFPLLIEPRGVLHHLLHVGVQCAKCLI